MRPQNSNWLRLQVIIILGSVVIFTEAGIGQVPSSGSWCALVSGDKDLIASVPNTLVFSKDQGSSQLLATAPGVWIKIYIGKNKNPMSLVEFERRQEPENVKHSQFRVGNSTGDLYSSDVNGYSLKLVIPSSKACYVITAASTAASSAILQDFLSSIHVDGSVIFKARPTGNLIVTETLNLDALKDSSEVINALNAPSSENVQIQYDYQKVVRRKLDSIEYSRPLVLLRKPKASYTKRAQAANVVGIVKLNVLFGADGRVVGITVVQGLEPDLTQQAIKAAMKIKFLPAAINSKAVDYMQLIQYGFDIY